MSSTSRAWMVAASVGAVEVLKDQGFCRWNYALRSLHQHAKNNLRSFSQAKRFSSTSSPMITRMMRDEKMKQSEESLRKVIIKRQGKMSSTSRAWIVAASVVAVEVLKDQGFCRWNYSLRSLHQHAKNNIRSFSQASKLSSPSSSVIANKMRDQKMKQSEESLRKVMYLSCWGPN
ncbi:hypothetical protein HHK36_005452 [Tetracentron sinense]|uniref:Wound-responsive family protein n=1 Tax=Tetracentron sinense TaxID=13715 RepID=A0A834ZNB6_TETSI|nr:hypothetical protein HHK36_005452 [Tetracentron sinense]